MTTNHLYNNLFLLFSWTTSGLKSQGRLSVGSNRDREISMSVGLGRSQLDSKGGVVGGTIDVNALEMVGMLTFYTNISSNIILEKTKSFRKLNLVNFSMNFYGK